MQASPEGLYVGTSNTVVVPQNKPGCQVYVYDGRGVKTLMKGGFGYTGSAGDASSMARYNGCLYVGTGQTLFDPSTNPSYGCMVFRYDPSRKAWSRVFKDTRPGFGDPHNAKAAAMLSSNYGLVVGTQYFSTQQRGGEAWLVPVSFYFAEGTARPGFETYFCIQNPGDAPATALLTYMDSEGGSTSQSMSLAASARVTVRPADALAASGSEAVDFSTTVLSPDNDQMIVERPEYFDFQGEWPGGSDVMGAGTPASDFYFAEGTTRPGFVTFFCIQNPAGDPAAMKITYMKGDGTTAVQDLSVGAVSRATVNAGDFLGSGDGSAYDFSAHVECESGGSVVVERPMYFDYEGVWPGGHDVMGLNLPAPAFYFAEGTARPGFETYFCLQNPGGESANVLLTYMKGDGTMQAQNVVVAPHSRATVKPSSILGVADDPAHDFSTKVECTNGVAIVAERPMYFDYNGWTGGHNVMGSTSPSSVLYFAEGSCRPDFDPYVTVQNPGSGPADVSVKYMTADGGTACQAVSIPAFSRATLHPSDVLGVGDDPAHDFSFEVECTNGQEIVAERPMYFDYQGWTGGHNAMGLAP